MSHNDNNGQYVGLRPEGCCTLLNDRVIGMKGIYTLQEFLGLSSVWISTSSNLLTK